MVDVGAVSAVAIHAWNSYMDFMFTQMIGQQWLPPAVERMDRILDEGVPDDIENNDQKNAEPSAEKLDEGDSDASGEKIELIGQGEMVVDLGIDVGIDLTSSMKFDAASIDAMESTRSLVGASMAFEPQSIRLKLVIPRQSVHEGIQAATLWVKRLGGMDTQLMGIEVLDPLEFKPVKGAEE